MEKLIKPTQPTKESRALAAAIAESGLTKAAIAEQLDVSPGMVSQWASGHRPVSFGQALGLSAILRIADPASISAAFAELQDQLEASNAGATVSDGQVTKRRVKSLGRMPAISGMSDVDPELAIHRLENDVYALNLALGALTSVMVAHRPAEAQAAAAAMKRNIPSSYRDTGLIQQLISVLERAGAPG
jgi:predicted transcriptional regulator